MKVYGQPSAINRVLILNAGIGGQQEARGDGAAKRAGTAGNVAALPGQLGDRLVILGWRRRRLLIVAEVAELPGLLSLSSSEVAVDYANELVHTERLSDRLSGSAG
jgi:hypothetical protein